MPYVSIFIAPTTEIGEEYVPAAYKRVALVEGVMHMEQAYAVYEQRDGREFSHNGLNLNVNRSLVPGDILVMHDAPHTLRGGCAYMIAGLGFELLPDAILPEIGRADIGWRHARNPVEYGPATCWPTPVGTTVLQDMNTDLDPRFLRPW